MDGESRTHSGVMEQKEGRKRKTYCVWRNSDDCIIALDEPSPKCAELMGIALSTFQNAGYSRKAWTVMLSSEIEMEEEYCE